MTDWTNDMRMLRQVTLEARMADQGHARTMDEIKEATETGHAERTAGGDMLLRQWIVAATAAVHRWRSREPILAADLKVSVEELRAAKRKPGKTPDYLAWLDGMGSDRVAFLTLRAAVQAAGALDENGQGEGRHDALTSLANALERAAWDVWIAKSEDRRNLVFDIGKRAVRGSWNAKGYRLNRDRALAQLPEKWIAWPPKGRMSLAVELMDLVETHLGIVSSTVEWRKGQSIKVYHPTPALADALRARNTAVALLFPAMTHFAHPPKPWEACTVGAFWTDKVKGVKLIRTRRAEHMKRMDARIAEGTAKPFLTAINACQNTAWRINAELLGHVKRAVAANAEIAGIPPMDRLPIPSPPFEDFKTAEKEQVSTFLRAKSAAIRAESAAFPRRLAVQTVLNQAAELMEDEVRRDAFWFAWSCDYRGRMLPIQTGLQPQGSKLAKALLEFADGKPIDTDEAEYWLAVHVANEFGQDKLNLDERAAWTMTNDAMLRRVANDPFGRETLPMWSTIGAVAKLEPWMALRAAIEWSNLRKACGENRVFVSHLPINIDGTCNGLQHLAAMTRDHIVAERVNLSGQSRGDVYALVADATMTTLRHMVSNGTWPNGDPLDEDVDKNEAKRQWSEALVAFGITRSDAKKAVMTIPYGAGMQKCLKDIEDGFVEQITRKVNPKVSPWGEHIEDGKGLRAWGAMILYANVTDKIGASMNVMHWLEMASRPFSEKPWPMPLQWPTPSGFLVHQEITEALNPNAAASLVRIGGTKRSRKADFLRLRIEIPGTIDMRDQQQKIAPNFIHSYDAAHLCLTVEACVEAGVSSFALIHDSFGTHAADVQRLWETTQECFQRIYRLDVLMDQKDRWDAALEAVGKDPTPLCPFYGAWDPEAPMNPHFFS